jgi:hypothetical protein
MFKKGDIVRSDYHRSKDYLLVRVTECFSDREFGGTVIFQSNSDRRHKVGYSSRSWASDEFVIDDTYHENKLEEAINKLELCFKEEIL